ncbi:hypothetical protein JMG10_06330 [Nostoc ellipsosporum NOK]|jgi:hypothetical protein|nr:hypothetical protein [Nostoc ellipsosporum NOK]
MKASPLLCPSAVCAEGAQLIGVVNKEGTVDLLADPLPVTADFVEAAFEGRAPEQRFRFANTCAKNGCRQWNGQGCSISDMVADFIRAEEIELQLPACGIRPECRWYHQHGATACAGCHLVVTDNTPQPV